MDMFEEWRSTDRSKSGHANQAVSSSSQLQQQAPIFTLRKLDWQATTRQLGRMICCLCTSNNVLVAATTACTVFRWNLDSNSLEEEIEISRKPEDSIEHVFLDPSGHHAVICLKNAENYYLHSRSTRPKKLSKLQGAVTSIAFDRQPGNESATRSFLVGTRQGCLYEMALDSGGKEKTCQLVHQLEKPLAITAIHFESLSEVSTGGVGVGVGSSSGNSSSGSLTVPTNFDTRLFILLATASISAPTTRLYHFLGGPTFQQLFRDNTASFTELPGEMRRTELACYCKSAQSRANLFAMMTKEGIYHGELLFASSQSTAEIVLSNAQLTPYIASSHDTTPALSIAATEYHFLTLQSDRLQFVSRLSGSLVQEELLRPGDGQPLGLIRDATRGITWLYTDLAVFQVTAHNEDLKIWSIYLHKATSGEERLFDTAYEHCKKKEEQTTVLRAQADYYLSRGAPDKAAVYYARSVAPFEEVVLRLLSSSVGPAGSAKVKTMLATTDGPELSSLRVYLQEELKILPANSKSQRTMICTWLCEIFLHQISNASFFASDIRSAGTAPCSFDSNRLSEGDLLAEFKDFIRSNRNVLDQATTLTLLTSRGHSHHRALLLFYAQIIGDYDRVVAHYISEQRYSDAINLLMEAPFEQVEALIYKCAPVLIQHEPESTAQMFMSKPRLRVQGLLPALLRYESFLQPENSAKNSSHPPVDRDFQGQKANFAILFLQNFLSNAEANDIVPDAIVHHTLVWLLAKYDDSSETELTTFLQQIYDKRCLGASLVAGFNPEYVLRQCKRFDRKRAIVFCFLLLDMESAAVNAALAIDIDLAKAVAQKPLDAAKKKDLWTMIARYVVACDKDAKRALALLSESGDVLKIEDLLPLLPDFTEIELFKEEICRTLEDCGTRIDHLKVEMEELSESADGISLELESMKKRGYSASSQQRCEYCSDAIFCKQFYLFPCSHGFHSDCLLKRVFTHKHLDNDQLVTVKSLEEQLRLATIRAKDADKRALSQQEFLQNEIDGFIAADCPLCGFVMIRSLSVPLIGEDDANEVLSWRL